jgi:hypothetical protein
MQPITTDLPGKPDKPMPVATLKSLHTFLRLLENTSELKRKMAGSFGQRSVKEGLSEISKLAGIDIALFKDQHNIAALIGSHRFVMIWGEPSVTTHVARIFDCTRVLFNVLATPGDSEITEVPQTSAYSGPAHQETAVKTLAASWAMPTDASSEASAALIPTQQKPLQSLNPLMVGNRVLTFRLFRALFEHILGFASPSSAQQESAVLVNELTGNKGHGRLFLATAMFMMGAEIDRENLMSFMLDQGLFGMQLFEHLLQNRDYCAAYYSFRRLERAFVSSAAEEEKHLKLRVDQFNAQFGGNPCEEKAFEAVGQGKASIDAHLAALDLLEAIALTPLSMVLNNSMAADSTYCVRSLKIIARHFERFANGEETKEQANQEITDHLLAFARQFSADKNTAPLH